MRNLMFLLCLLLASCSCSNNSDSTTHQIDNGDMNEGNKTDLTVRCEISEDSLMYVIYEQFSKDNVSVEYYNKSVNSENIVPAGYLKIPDSIAYEKVTYKDGNICCEGLVVFYESIECDGVEVGIWKYRTPDGLKFEKEYKFTNGIVDD